MIYGIKNPIKSTISPDTPAARAPVITMYQVSMLARAQCAHLNAPQVTHTIHALTRTHLGFMSDAPADLDFPLRDSPVHRSPLVQIPL